MFKAVTLSSTAAALGSPLRASAMVRIPTFMPASTKIVPVAWSRVSYARSFSSSSAGQPKEKELLKGIPKNVVDEKTGSSKPATLSTILKKKETREESWEIMKYMSKFVWPENPAFRIRVLGSAACIVLAKLATIQAPIQLGALINSLSVPVTAVTTPLLLLSSFVLAKICQSAFTELRGIIFSNVSQDACRRIARKAFEHVHTLDISFLIGSRSGEVQAIISRSLRSVTSMLNMMLFNMIPTALEFSLVLWILATHAGIPAALITSATMAAYVGFTTHYTTKRNEYRRKMNMAENEANARLLDSVINAESVRFFANEKRETELYDESLAKYEKENIRVLKSLGRLNFGQQLIYNSGLFATLFLALNQCVAGTLPVGDLVMINTLLMQLSSPLNMIGMVYRETTMSLVDMSKLHALMRVQPSIKDAPDAKDLVLKGGQVSIKDLSFDYGSDSRKILDGFSLDIPAGHRVAIVGSSGAGKSTVLRLLLRMYAPTCGSISIDGQPIDKVTLSSLRKNIGIVPQDCSLFHDTVFNNILYGRLDATEEEVVAAAKLAEIHDTIMNFPRGYQTLVGERGLKLSGGERQRIGIARCLLKNPELVLFDEATSALDSETEQNILKGFEQLTASRTSLIVAHRLSTVMNCDTICVLDEGKVAEKGSHKELMNIENGKYRQLWERQFLVDEAESIGESLKNEDDAGASSSTTTA